MRRAPQVMRAATYPSSVVENYLGGGKCGGYALPGGLVKVVPTQVEPLQVRQVEKFVGQGTAPVFPLEYSFPSWVGPGQCQQDLFGVPRRRIADAVATILPIRLGSRLTQRRAPDFS